MLKRISLCTKALRAAVVLGCLTLSFLLLPLAAFAAVGSITSVNGQVSILRGGQLPAVTAAVGTEVNVGDFVRTKSSSGCEIRFTDGNVIKVGPRSRIDISEYAIDRDTRTIGLTRGKVEAIVVPPPKRDTKVQPKRFEIHSPNAVAGIRGTDLLVFYEGGTTGILVISLHGGDNVYAYSLSNPDQLIDLPAGFITYIRDNQLPTPGRQATEAEINALIRELLARLGIDPDILLGGLDGANGLTDVPVTDNFSLLQPAYEVGRVDMTTWMGSLDVNMTTQFLSPTTGGPATSWIAGISGSWGDTEILIGDVTYLSGNGPNGSADATFTVTDWNTTTGQWTADINSNSPGAFLSTEVVDFSGTGSGAIKLDVPGDPFWGTISGSAGGGVTPSMFSNY